MFDKYKINALIFHDPCSDGMCAAACLYKFAKDNNLQDIDYIGDNFSNTNINKILERIKGKYLVICDYSYSEEIINKIKEITENFIIIDHHKTAQKDLENIPNEHKIFDMSRSGAKLMWDFLFDKEPVPKLVEYVQDRDLFTNLMPNINDFVNWFYNLTIDINTYYYYLTNDKKLLNCIHTKGCHYTKITNIYINSLLKTKPILSLIDNKLFFVAYQNSPIFISDIGHLLLKKYKFVDFSVVYNVYSDCITKKYSLRSDSDFYDVSKIAKLSNGGGHRNASGISNITSEYCYLPSSTKNYHRLYPLINKSWFSLDKLNIIYINYKDNCEILQDYILSPRETENFTYLQQAQYIYKTLCNINTNELPVFDACIIHKKNLDNNQFIIKFFNESKNTFIDKLKEHIIDNIITLDKEKTLDDLL